LKNNEILSEPFLLRETMMDEEKLVSEQKNESIKSPWQKESPLSQRYKKAKKGLIPEKKIKMDIIELFIEFICDEKPIFLKALLENIEKSIILNILFRVKGNQREAANVLGIKYTTLNEKIKRYNIRFQKKPVIFSS
jgi:DNA-binding NtrC family response regulator